MKHDLDDINFGVQAFYTAILAEFGPQMDHRDVVGLAACRDELLKRFASVFGTNGQANTIIQLVKR